MAPDQVRAARQILDFYMEAGVDAALTDVPVDRLTDRLTIAPGETGVPSASPVQPQSNVDKNESESYRPGTFSAPRSALQSLDGGEQQRRTGPSAPPPSADAAALAAREAAHSAASLQDLRAILERFEGCALRGTAKQLVFADGYDRARVMFVGEAPGREEDLEGVPFVGRSGKLLDLMLAAVSLDRTLVYIANIVPWRPPGNRTPTPQEAAICMPFIKRQIELVDPDVLVCLGGPSMAALLGVKDGIRKMRGRWFEYHTGTRAIRAMPTFHPAYLLRTPLEKRNAWRDFLAIRSELEKPASAKG